jgi:hypothetical protein
VDWHGTLDIRIVHGPLIFCFDILPQSRVLNWQPIPASTQAACFWCPGPTPTQAPQGSGGCGQTTCCSPPITATCACTASYGGSIKSCCAMFNYVPYNCANYNGGGGGGGGGGSGGGGGGGGSSGGGGSGGSSSHGGSVSVPKPKPKVVVVTSATTTKEKPKAKVKVPDILSPTQTPPPHHLKAGSASSTSSFAGLALGSAVVVALAYGWSKRRVVNIAGAEVEDHGIITLADVARLERRKRRAEAQAAAKEQSQTRKVESKKGWARRFATAVKSKYLAAEQETKANVELSETPYASA